MTADHLPVTDSLELLQTDDQRLVLDVVAQIRKCGLDGVLSLPQIVVCGDQSAGKSSVLEAVTEIPFPRNDNLCTRFATEITLRRAVNDLLIVRVIPDDRRLMAEQTAISAFSETISDFHDLPQVMAMAMEAMGLEGASATSTPARAFARDILSIEIEGPSRPQLTLVDVPGLIQTRARTLKWVREVDPSGERTLGVITKPDRLDQGSGSEAAFLALARNEDIFFKLGWHVVKNRKFEEAASSFQERNASEASFFRNSNFKVLPADCVGIDALRGRLSALLFEHVRRELPNLRRDLETAIADTNHQLEALGPSRATASECRTYLTQLSMTCLSISKAAIDGHYEEAYFRANIDTHFSPDSPSSIRRFRAVVQHLNHDFASIVRSSGPKYFISSKPGHSTQSDSPGGLSDITPPKTLSKDEAIEWVAQVVIRARGKEPMGNYNPLIIGELFWELSDKWSKIATQHVQRVFGVSQVFFDTLLHENCPRDVRTRLSALKVADALQKRCQSALDEVGRLIEDKGEFPVTYNHYYTDTVQKKQSDRMRGFLERAIDKSTSETLNPGCNSTHTSTKVDVTAVLAQVHSQVDRDMLHYSCEHLLDCVLSMYKDQMKTFVQNVAIQAIERHMVRGLDQILSPLFVSGLSDEEVLKVVSEPIAVKRQRDFLDDRLEKLMSGQTKFRHVVGVVH